MVSIICPVYNEEKYIAQFLDSLLKQDYPKDNIEIIIIDGISNDQTRIIAEKYALKYSFIRIIDNVKKTTPCALNIGINQSNGEIIVRLDAHASYSPNYISVLVRQLYVLNANNVGAVCKTDVLNKNQKSLAIREVLSNPLGVGNSIFRTGIDKIMQVDTVPFGCWKRETFTKFGMFDERLDRNQDFEYNHRISEGGGKIYIVPDTCSTYYARETLSALWKQNYLNGMWGIKTIIYTQNYKSLAVRHYIPLIFVLSLLVPIFLSILWWPIALLSFISLATYAFLILLFSFILSIKKKLNIFYLIASFATLHISNGCGMLISLLYIPKYTKNKNVP